MYGQGLLTLEVKLSVASAATPLSGLGVAGMVPGILASSHALSPGSQALSSPEWLLPRAALPAARRQQVPGSHCTGPLLPGLHPRSPCDMSRVPLRLDLTLRPGSSGLWHCGGQAQEGSDLSFLIWESGRSTTLLSPEHLL